MWLWMVRTERVSAAQIGQHQSIARKLEIRRERTFGDFATAPACRQVPRRIAALALAQAVRPTPVPVGWLQAR
jgi:hypothetical protein